jgi:HNH endonuclease
MVHAGDVISYSEMCAQEGLSLQRGMNFKVRGGLSIVLMSRRPGAPYDDEISGDGLVLLYEGHDVAKTVDRPNPKAVDQPLNETNGTRTQNGKFFKAAIDFRERRANAEVVKVYEKVKAGIWVFNGYFRLVDAWTHHNGIRSVVKFKLELINESSELPPDTTAELSHTRLIPTSVKVAVWKRDGGKCVKCGSQDNLHFDHIIPFSLGGSSVDERNVQLLCARHNLEKHDRID